MSKFPGLFSKKCMLLFKFYKPGKKQPHFWLVLTLL